MAAKKPCYFERPDDEELPLTVWQILLIVLSSHLGVRPREQRNRDFRRANGLIAGLIYFAVLLVVMVVLVNYISG